MGEVKIAIATETPLYLPLFLAKRHRFFDYFKSNPIVISPEPGRRINDWDFWAAQQVNDKRSEFALCDPLEALRFNDVGVIGLLVEVAAFWVVARDSQIGNPQDLARFKRVFTYPNGMTANRITRFLVHECSGPKPTIHGVEVNTELEQLKQNKDSAAVTANIVRALQLREKMSSERFTITDAWGLHPSLSALALTGIVAHKEKAASDEAHQFLQSLQKAAALASADRQEALWTLSSIYGQQRLPESFLDEAVQRLQDARLWSFLLYPGLNYFSNAWYVSKRYGDWWKHEDRMHDRDWLLPQSATKLRRDLEKQIVPKADDLWRPVRTLLDGRDTINVNQYRVIGGYVRGNKDARTQLRGFVDQFRQVWDGRSRAKRAFLIWGPPGEGKTSLIEEFIKGEKNKIEAAKAKTPQSGHVQDEPELVEIRMDADHPEREFDRKIRLVSKNSGRGSVIAVIDEIDSGEPKHWLPHKLLHLIDKGINGRPTIVVLIGSYRGGINELKDKLSKYTDIDTKIDDVFSRIGDKEISVPYLDFADILVIIAALAKAKGKTRIRTTELYYFMITQYGSSTRKLVEDTNKWLSRGPLESTSRSVKERAEFWHSHREAHRCLRDGWLTIA